MKWKTLDWDIMDIKDMNENHIKNCIKQLQNRITDPADIVWYESLWTSFTEMAVIEENERIQKIIEEFEKELKYRL